MSNFLSQDYADLRGLVLLRKEILENPLYYEGTVKLDHDPRKEFNELYFNQIYCSGAVYGVYK